MLSAFKNFAVTVLIALLIFGFGAFFAIKFLNTTMNSILTSEKEELSSIVNKGEDEDPSDENNPLTPIDPEEIITGESFSFLLVITDYRPDVYGDYMPNGVQLTAGKTDKKEDGEEDPYDVFGPLSADYREAGAAAIVLVTADKERKQYTYTYFSPESRMYTPSGHHTLGEAYSYYGIETLAEHIHALTGITPSYRMTVNGYNLDEIVDQLGSVSLILAKSIYFDGKNYTTEHERTVETEEKDGKTSVEHIANTFVLGSGAIDLDRENIGILAALSERSMADITMKEYYTVEAVKQYLGKLGEMEDDELKILVSKLTLNESDWINIDGMDEETGAESDSDLVDVPPSDNNPWWSDDPWWSDETDWVIWETEEEPLPSDEPSETTEGETGEAEETVYLFEPETPVLETSFTSAELEKIGGVLKAIAQFEQVTESYPGKFVDAKEDRGAYFDLNTKSGLSKFLSRRGEK